MAKSEIKFLEKSDPIPPSTNQVLVDYFESQDAVDLININFIERLVDNIWKFRITFEMPTTNIESIGGTFETSYSESLTKFNTYLAKELSVKRLKYRRRIVTRESDPRIVEIFGPETSLQ